MRRLTFFMTTVVFVFGFFHTPIAHANPRPVTRVEFYSIAVARNMAFNIILPIGYDSNAKRYPTLYLLHGRNGNLNSWPQMRVPEYAVPYDLIIVMPDVGSSWYVNWVQSDDDNKNNWADYITQDLLSYVDANYRTIRSRQGRAISGLSMGGYGALTLGLLNPNLFCSINSHSGALRFLDLIRAHINNQGDDPLILTPKKEAEVKAAAQNSNSLQSQTPSGHMVTTLKQCDAIDPFKIIRDIPTDQLPDIRLQCGMDENLYPYSKKFADLLIELNIPFTYAQTPGKHNPENWTRAVRYSIAHQYAVMTEQLQIQ